jgi:hypothetical protein
MGIAGRTGTGATPAAAALAVASAIDSGAAPQRVDFGAILRIGLKTKVSPSLDAAAATGATPTTRTAHSLPAAPVKTS